MNAKKIFDGLSLGIVLDFTILLLSYVYFNPILYSLSFLNFAFSFLLLYLLQINKISSVLILYNFKIILYLVLITTSIYFYDGYQSIFLYYLVPLPVIFLRVEFLKFKTLLLIITPIIVALYFSIFSQQKYELNPNIANQPFLYFLHFIIIFILINYFSDRDIRTIERNLNQEKALNNNILDLNNKLELKIKDNIKLTNIIIHDSLKPFFTLIHDDKLDKSTFKKLNETYDFSYSIATKYMTYFNSEHEYNTDKTSVSTFSTDISKMINNLDIIIKEECNDEIILIPRSILYAIFNNLYANSIEHSKLDITSLEIKIVLFKDAKNAYLIITYEDNGMGINQNSIDFLFKSHSQIKEDKTLGCIGLYSVKTILNQFNGDIHLSNEILPLGNIKAKFIIYTPLG